MTTTLASRFEVTNAAPAIGSVIHADKETLLSGKLASDIRALMEQRGVLVFPKIGLTDEEQIAFTKTLGTFAREKSEQRDEADGDQVYAISMDPKVNLHADYLRGAFFWHIDGTMSDKPILGSIMSARSLSREGGETDFCNTYAAFEALPEEDRRRIKTCAWFMPSGVRSFTFILNRRSSRCRRGRGSVRTRFRWLGGIARVGSR